MSVFIRGMKMPRKTGIVSIVLAGDGSASMCEDGTYSEIEVIHVPKHGRLIDADALYIEILNRGIDGLQLSDFSEIQQVIEDAPTIIEAEEG